MTAVVAEAGACAPLLLPSVPKGMLGALGAPYFRTKEERKWVTTLSFRSYSGGNRRRLEVPDGGWREVDGGGAIVLGTP